MLIFLLIIILVLALGYAFMQQPQFGKPSSGAGLVKIIRSPNFREGQFQNISDTPSLTGGTSYPKVMKEFFFGKSKEAMPPGPLPSMHTDLHSIDPNENVLVWFGHSSYFMQIDGKKILVDPVLSGAASPVKFTTRSFKGSDVYTVDDIPEIDFLFISHDHWDHLDYLTLIKLKPKVARVITGLGVASHLEYWGYDKKIIEERDWNEEIRLGDGFIVNTVSARHFSGRAFKRNQSLWMAFVLTTPTKNIFIGGDSGYDRHFAEIGERFGPFDLAILENGQYNIYWRHIHMMPEEVVQAAIDLRARKLLPVHWGKFSLSLHAWNEPVIRVVKEAEEKNVGVIHPMIGEPVPLDGDKVYSRWWESINEKRHR
jgi:L-ascorbate metabolism protein UlaG (beta-lactamase superfamily)